MNQAQTFHDLTDLIGNTPVLEMRNIVPPKGARIFGKLEWYNIGGSVKDRAALYMIESAESSGALTHSRRIIEATSGNTGIALSMIGGYKGYGVTIVMSEAVSIERQKIIRAYGAELILTPADKGTAGAIEKMHSMVQKEPEKYVSLDQFRNPANVLAHYHGTANEIVNQMDGRLDMLVCSVGTGGTSNGVGKRLKQLIPGLKVVGVTPAVGVKIQGIRNPKEPYPSEWVDLAVFDEFIELDERGRDSAFGTALLAARREGLLLGMSSACALDIAIRKSSELGEGRRILAIFPDSGYKYLSSPDYLQGSMK